MTQTKHPDIPAGSYVYTAPNGQKMAYAVSGQGAPLILMHGWGCNSSTVASIANTASQTNTVYNVDFPGFGASPEPDSIWGIERYTRLIEDFTKDLGLDNPVLVGHSFGGRVALLMSSRTPVSKVVLVDAAGLKPHRSLKYYLKVYSFKAAKRLYRMIYGAEKSKEKIEKMRSHHGSSDYKQSTPVMRGILSRVVNEDLSDRLGHINAPTLLIWGAKDKATPLKDATRMKKEIKNSELIVFPEAGHYSFLDNPARFAAVLNSYLKQ